MVFKENNSILCLWCTLEIGGVKRWGTSACFSSTYTNTGTIQGRLAWPLFKGEAPNKRKLGGFQQNWFPFLVSCGKRRHWFSSHRLSFLHFPLKKTKTKQKQCVIYSIMSGGFNAASRSTTDEEKDYQDMICLGRKGRCFSQRRRAQSLSLQGLLLGSFT